MRKRVLVVYTGGTIGMRRSSGGYAPEPGLLKKQLDGLEELHRDAMPEYEVVEFDPLLDSSNMTPHEWMLIADEIAHRYDDFDGFVVIHGTDTMAYSASALSFMLKNLSKPVVVTGSQIPLCEIRNDARQNVLDALTIAAEYRIPEVCLQFSGKLMRGNRSLKVSATGLDAFASPNYPLLGRARVTIDIDWKHVLDVPEGPLVVRHLSRPKVGALRLFPGIDATVVENVLKPPIQGLVLECYGVGNAPNRDRRLLAAVEEATTRGVVVAVVTQCIEGRVNLGGYATGSALERAGAISGVDMTAEAAMTKMYYLLSQEPGAEEVRARMGEDLRGELTA